jgi:hypothetical protein
MLVVVAVGLVLQVLQVLKEMDPVNAPEQVELD